MAVWSLLTAYFADARREWHQIVGLRAVALIIARSSDVWRYRNGNGDFALEIDGGLAGQHGPTSRLFGTAMHTRALVLLNFALRCVCHSHTYTATHNRIFR